MIRRLGKVAVKTIGVVAVVIVSAYAVMVGVMFAIMPKLEQIEEDDYDDSWIDEDLDD